MGIPQRQAIFRSTKRDPLAPLQKQVPAGEDAASAPERLSPKDYWPIALIGAGLLVTAVWMVMIGWAVLHIVAWSGA